MDFYLVEEGGRLTLIDAGGARHWGLFLETLGSIGRRLEDLEAIVLTHAHSDHTGFAERARTEAHAGVHVHRADAGPATTGKTAQAEAGYGRYLLKLEAYKTLFTLGRAGALKIVPIEVVSSFEDGQTIDVPGRPRTVHMPGHTKGSCGILLEDRRALVTGDCLVTRNPFTGRVGPQIMPAGLNEDSAGALRSLDALVGVPADILLPGHGDPWTGEMSEAVRLAREAGPS